MGTPDSQKEKVPVLNNRGDYHSTKFEKILRKEYLADQTGIAIQSNSRLLSVTPIISQLKTFFITTLSNKNARQCSELTGVLV